MIVVLEGVVGSIAKLRDYECGIMRLKNRADYLFEPILSFGSLNYLMHFRSLYKMRSFFNLVKLFKL